MMTDKKAAIAVVVDVALAMALVAVTKVEMEKKLSKMEPILVDMESDADKLRLATTTVGSTLEDKTSVKDVEVLEDHAPTTVIAVKEVKVELTTTEMASSSSAAEVAAEEVVVAVAIVVVEEAMAMVMATAEEVIAVKNETAMATRAETCAGEPFYFSFDC